MKNVLMIMDYAAPYKGNFINSLENLESNLNKNKYHVIYLFPHTAKNLVWINQLVSAGKKIYFIQSDFFGKKINLKKIAFLASLLRREEIDIIHTHFIENNYSLFLTKNLFFRKKKIIGHFHCQFRLTKNIIGNFKRFIIRNTFDLIIGVGESVAKGVIAEKIPETKVTFIPNAIYFERLNSYQSIKIKEDQTQKVVLMFGWLFYVKGVDIAIKAINQLNRAGYNITLAISLSGGLEEIKTLIKKTFGTMPECVKFLEARNDVATYFNASDVFLSASREEGLNYSVIEAAYCNPMVVVSNIPGNPLDIPGLFIHEAGNVPDLVEKLQNALQISDELKIKIKNPQHEYVVANYNLDKWSNDVMKYYE